MGLCRPKYKNGKILFISPVFLDGINSTSSDYFSYIISSLAQKLGEVKKRLDFVVKFPKKDNDYHTEQTRFINDALEVIDDYQAIIISPYDRDKLIDKLADLKELIEQDKLFLIDQGIPEKEYKNEDLGNEVHRPPYVQADWKQGGEVAGNSMARYFRDNANVNDVYPNIILVEGKIGSQERIEGFIEGLGSLKNEGFKVNPMWYPNNVEGEYSKEIASLKFKPVLDWYLKEERLIHGIFTCNDEMALGVRDVLEYHKEQIENIRKTKNGDLPILPIIIGFDGIKDVTTLIDKKNEFIYDTVVVNIDKQIEKLVKMIQKIVIRNDKRIIDNERFMSIECESYKWGPNAKV